MHQSALEMAIMPVDVAYRASSAEPAAVLEHGAVVPLSVGGAKIIALAIVLIFLTGLWTALRIWCRKLRRVPLQLEDWLHFVALLAYYGQLGGTFASLAYGAGHPTKELGKLQVENFQKTALARQAFYALSSGLVKMSICVLLMKVFVLRRLKIFARCIMVLSALWSISTILVALLICRPIEANWDRQIPNYVCGNHGVAYTSIAAANVLLEVALLILPVPVLWKLQLSLRYKIALLGVFGSGVLTVTIAVLRIPILLQTDYTNTTYDTGAQMITFSEPAVALIVSSSPILKPVFDIVVERCTCCAVSRQKKNSHQSSSFGQSADISNRQYLELGEISSREERGTTEVFSHPYPFEGGLSGTDTGTANDSPRTGIIVQKDVIVTRDN